jgi:hypothetical protein
MFIACLFCLAENTFVIAFGAGFYLQLARIGAVQNIGMKGLRFAYILEHAYFCAHLCIFERKLIVVFIHQVLCRVVWSIRLKVVFIHLVFCYPVNQFDKKPFEFYL